MRFSNPMTASRLRRPISESTTATFLPIIARAVPRFAVVVVLPTPPFPDVMVITRLSICVSIQGKQLRYQQLFARWTAINPGLYDNLVVPDGRHFRTRLRFISFGRTREQVGDAQLHRGQQ